MKKPRPFEVRPPTGPAVHAAPIRPPGKRTPHWYWRCVVYEAGGERTVWTGRGTEDDVRAEVWQLIGRGEHRDAPAAEPEAVTCDTVAELLAYWRGHLLESTELAPRTVQGYISRSRTIEAGLGPVVLERLSRRDVERYRVQALRHRSAGTVKNELINLGQAWEWGRMMGACPDRDLEIPDVAPKPVRDKYTPTDGEVAAVIRRQTVAWRKQVLELQWATGARISEIALLQGADIDAARGQLWLGRHEGGAKTGARCVPMSAAIRRAVAGLPAAGPVWPVAWATIDSAINAAVAAACEAEQIPVWTTHGLRRAFVNVAIRRGVDVATLATLTGHSVQTLMTYYRQVQEDERVAAMAAMDRELPAGEVIDLAARRLGSGRGGT